MWQEFKEFAFKGNAFDLAVGVIIGLAFGKIVDSIVNHLIMPIVGAVFGGLNFDNYFIRLSSAVTATNLADAQKQGAVFAYGAFLTVLINFLIIAWIVFMLLLPAGAVAGWDLHPLESAALSRRTPDSDIGCKICCDAKRGFSEDGVVGCDPWLRGAHR